MLKQIYKINEEGYLKDIFVKDFNEDGNCTEELADNIITVDPPNGLYRAKWTGTEWIEDMSQDEIDGLNNQPYQPTEADMIMLAILELDMQRELDKTETQLAIAELAETILGGM